MQTLITLAIVAVGAVAWAKLRQFEADAARYGRGIDGEYDVGDGQ